MTKRIVRARANAAVALEHQWQRPIERNGNNGTPRRRFYALQVSETHATPATNLAT